MEAIAKLQEAAQFYYDGLITEVEFLDRIVRVLYTEGQTDRQPFIWLSETLRKKD